MIAIPYILVTAEAEEVVDNATTGCGDVDLFGCHPNMVAQQREMSQATRFLVVTFIDFSEGLP